MFFLRFWCCCFMLYVFGPFRVAPRRGVVSSGRCCQVPCVSSRLAAGVFVPPPVARKREGAAPARHCAPHLHPHLHWGEGGATALAPSHPVYVRSYATSFSAPQHTPDWRTVSGCHKRRATELKPHSTAALCSSSWLCPPPFVFCFFAAVLVSAFS